MPESKKDRFVRLLQCTPEEAVDIIEADKAIDQGKKVDFDLDPESAKIAKKFSNAGVRKAPTVYVLDTKDKVRKENPTKGSLIKNLASFLMANEENDCQEVEIVNKERQINFKVENNHYELTLTQKRVKKGD